MSATFSEWNKWKIVPLGAVYMQFGNDSLKIYYFSTLDSTSEFQFKYITEKNDRGGETPVAVAIEGSINVIQNNYVQFKEFQQDVLNLECNTVRLSLFNVDQGPDAMYLNHSPVTLDTEDRPVLELETYEILTEINVKRPSPSMKIYIKGTLGLDIIKEYYDIFIQHTPYYVVL